MGRRMKLSALRARRWNQSEIVGSWPWCGCDPYSARPVAPCLHEIKEPNHPNSSSKHTARAERNGNFQVKYFYYQNYYISCESSNVTAQCTTPLEGSTAAPSPTSQWLLPSTLSTQKCFTAAHCSPKSLLQCSPHEDMLNMAEREAARPCES